MGNINPAFFDRVKYVLSCRESDTEEPIEEPIGWKSDEKEFARNEDYHGIFTKFSNSLKFIGTGADYINNTFKIYGINANLKLSKYERHPQTDKWIRIYWGFLDLSTWEFENNQVGIKFNSGGLEQIIKSRENESVEVDRLETMDGKILPALPTNEVLLEGRRIFLKSKWEVNVSPGEVASLEVHSDDGNDRSTVEGVPMNLINQSHEQAQSVLFNSGAAGEGGGTTGMMMMANFDRDRQIRIHSNSFKFKPHFVYGLFDWAYFKVCLTVYSGGTNYDFKERRELFYAGHSSPTFPNILSIQDNLYNLNFDETFDVNEGDSIAFNFLLRCNLGITTQFRVNLTELEGDVFAEEDSFFEPSKSKFIFVHDLIDRLTSICANESKLFYSEYFGRIDLGYLVNGPGAFVGSSHGFWIRGFDKLPLSTEDYPNLFKSFTTSLRDTIASVNAVFNVGMGIEEISNKERIRIEPLSYFYNNNVTIKLGNQVKNLKRSVAPTYFASSLEIGYDKGGDYQEAQGLDEPNGKSNFTTVITRLKQTFSKISNFRADGYGKEFARRKPFSIYDTLDTQYDEDIWLLDLKKGVTNVFLERKWQDDFEEAPTGIFSPETANNLRLSPINNLLRHGWVIASGLVKYPLDKIRYGSSTGNSQLETKIIAANRYKESGNILNSTLERARFVPEWIEFEHECTFQIMQQVQETTTILGKEIPNFYGTVEFINDKNEIEKGFLFNLKPNGKGSWKVLKSNR